MVKKRNKKGTKRSISVCSIVRRGKCDVGLISWITSIVSSLKKKKERKKTQFFRALETDVETDLEAREMYRVIRTRY